MTKERTGLVAVKRMDRNGKMVTRHIKADASVPGGGKTIPAPHLKKPKITAANRAALINEAFGRSLPADTLKQTLERATPEMIQIIDDALEVYGTPSDDPVVIREKAAISMALGSLARGAQFEDRIACEMLALRSAFCSSWSQVNNAEISRGTMKRLIYGLNSGKALPLEKPEFMTKLMGPLRFAYELKERCPDSDFLPTEERPVNVNGDYRRGSSPSDQYTDMDLANFLFRENEHVADLIELAVKHKTTDAKVLAYLLETEGASTAVSSGWL